MRAIIFWAQGICANRSIKGKGARPEYSARCEFIAKVSLAVQRACSFVFFVWAARRPVILYYLLLFASIVGGWCGWKKLCTTFQCIHYVHIYIIYMRAYVGRSIMRGIYISFGIDSANWAINLNVLSVRLIPQYDLYLCVCVCVSSRRSFSSCCGILLLFTASPNPH